MNTIDRPLHSYDILGKFQERIVHELIQFILSVSEGNLMLEAKELQFIRIVGILHGLLLTLSIASPISL